jgi:hypothetical protein
MRRDRRLERGDTMGAKPKKTGTAARVPATKKRTPARRVPTRKTAGKSRRATTRDQTVDGYIAALIGEQAEVAERLRDLVRGVAPSAGESIKWGQPVYEDNGPFCYFKAGAEGVTIGFWRGAELDDPDGRLVESDGERMKHLELHSVDDIDEDAIGRWVRQAIDLNWRYGNPTQPGSQAIQDTAEEEAAAETAGATGSDEKWPHSGEDVVVDVDEGDERDGARYGTAHDETTPRPIEPVQPIESVVDDDSFEPAWKDSDR